MNYIERLIKEKCPNGVEYKTLEELGTFYSGLKAKSKADFGHGNGEFISYMNIFKNPSVKLDELEKIDVKENETYDISLYSEVKGGNVTKLENGTFEVKIPLSDALKDKDKWYYVNRTKINGHVYGKKWNIVVE